MLIQPYSQIPKKQIVLISADVLDPKSGRILERHEPRPANTFVQNWMKMQYTMFGKTTLVGCVDVAGAAHTHDGGSSYTMNFASPNTDNTYGILIGTGTTAVALTDYKLETQISANIAHAIMAFSLNAPDGTHYQVLASRMFTNNTGATLGIKEVALYAKPASGYIYCVDHTLYTLNVGNTLAATLTYTWTTNI